MTTAIAEWKTWYKNGNRVTDSIYGAIKFAAKPLAKRLYAHGRTANEVSIARLILSPISFYLLFSFEAPVWSYCLALLFWGYTDAVDGVMAKDPNLENKPDDDIGSMIDPNADKAMIGSLYVFQYANFPRIVVVTLLCEAIIVLLAMGSFLVAALKGEDLKSIISKMRSTYWGKFKLGLEITSALLMIWYAAQPRVWIEIAVITTATAAILLMLASLRVKVKKVLG